MGAFLVFGRDFKLSNDGKEYQGLDEVEYPISYGRLDKLESYCEAIGIPREAWPDFVDVDGDLNRVLLTDIKEKNSILKEAIVCLDNDAISQNEDLKLVAEELGNGRMLFITN